MKSTLRPCPACRKEIARGAPQCPHCGKRFTSAAGILAAILIALLIGGLLTLRACSEARRLDDATDRAIQRLR